MKTVAGIFRSREAADEAIERLGAMGVPEEKISLLAAGTNAREAEARAPLSDTEGSGVGTALGAVAGGSAGAAIGTLVATALIPGIGPVVAIGAVAAALFGVGGAVAGAAAGAALDNAAETGLPHDEIYVYEDALRKGRTVVIALAEDELQAERVRETLKSAGAESIDTARDQWWTGLRDAEQVVYEGDFVADESNYRAGFQAAHDYYSRGKSYPEVIEQLGHYYPTVYESESFRRGYERGRHFYREGRGDDGMPAAE